MSEKQLTEDSAVTAQADDIATKLTQFLIDGFRTKTGRNPDNNEIEQLFDELTPERVAELLGEDITGDCQDSDEGSCVEDDNEASGEELNSEEEAQNDLEAEEGTVGITTESNSETIGEPSNNLTSLEEKEKNSEPKGLQSLNENMIKKREHSNDAEIIDESNVNSEKRVRQQ